MRNPHLLSLLRSGIKIIENRLIQPGGTHKSGAVVTPLKGADQIC